MHASHVYAKPLMPVMPSSLMQRQEYGALTENKCYHTRGTKALSRRTPRPTPEAHTYLYLFTYVSRHAILPPPANILAEAYPGGL